MKKLIFLSCLIYIFNLSQSQSIKSVIVEYESLHYGVNSKHILYLTDYGKKKVMDVINPDKTTKRYLAKDGMDHTFMLERKDLNFKYPSIENDMIYHVYDMKTLTSHNFYVSAEKIRTEAILEKTCDVYKIITADKKEMVFYIWNGILLKKTSVYGHLNAVKIIDDPKFEEGQFEIPDGYIFK